MLRIEGLSKSFGGARPRAVLRAIDLDLARGEYIAIMGESGSGKSTLLNLIAGLDLPDAGSIVLDGVEVTALDDTARTLLRRSHIGFVFQAFHLLPHLTVAQNVALPLSLNRAPREKTNARVGEMLAAVGLAAAATVYPRELSGGEMQRVAIARALVHRPALLLADEPTGNLDEHTAEELHALLKEMHREHGLTSIIATHNSALASACDRVLRLEGGRLRPAGHSRIAEGAETDAV